MLGEIPCHIIAALITNIDTLCYLGTLRYGFGRQMSTLDAPTLMIFKIPFVVLRLGGLEKHGISCSVFEPDDTPDAHAQGYPLKIFPGTVPDLQYRITPELFTEFEVGRPRPSWSRHPSTPSTVGSLPAVLSVGLGRTRLAGGS
ncbi:hypothetical protein MMYC01_200486 [Madurella mycetomatis]|uniref:Uncharacterized protein n=1 Tax=Madurella mycetomatis TaxID=100816 RepID=A0A175WHM0_9PEZI|nr:hypothetical protein MMYC01_200486 [Madurella mycetomatis]